MSRRAEAGATVAGKIEQASSDNQQAFRHNGALKSGQNGAKNATTAIPLVLPYPPSVNAYWRAVPKKYQMGKGGTIPSAQGVRVIRTAEATQYKQDCGWVARSQSFEAPREGPLSLVIRVYRPQKRGDLDNVLKGLLDGCNGVVWVDDSQIVEMHLFRFDDAANPRVEMEVEAR